MRRLALSATACCVRSRPPRRPPTWSRSAISRSSAVRLRRPAPRPSAASTSRSKSSATRSAACRCNTSGGRQDQSGRGDQRRVQADRRRQGRLRHRAWRLEHADPGVQVVRRRQHLRGRRACGSPSVRRQGVPSERLLRVVHQRRLAGRGRPVHDQPRARSACSSLPPTTRPARSTSRAAIRYLQGTGGRPGLHAAHPARLRDRDCPHPRREAGRGVLVPGRRRWHRVLQAIRAGRPDGPNPVRHRGPGRRTR